MARALPGRDDRAACGPDPDLAHIAEVAQLQRRERTEPVEAVRMGMQDLIAKEVDLGEELAVVVAQAWLGAVCPLTSLEMWLRANARAATYRGSFIEHWLQRILYYEAPDWAFALVYTLFGLLVAVTWWRFPPIDRCGGGADGKPQVP